MSIKWRALLRSALKSLRDLALTILVFGSILVLISLILWPILFRRGAIGLSMALSLVGFGSWLLSFILSIGDRRRQRRMMSSLNELSAPDQAGPFLDSILGQTEQSGCGFILLLSSLVPLGIAFAIRLQADLRAGMTLKEIFPPMP